MPPHHQAFLAPVELVGLTELEGQRHEGVDRSPLALALAPGPNEVGHPAVAAVVPGRLDLGVQRSGCAPLMLGPPGIGLQRLLQRFMEDRELPRLLAAPVLRRAIDLAVQPLRNRVARQPRDARDLALRLVLPAMQTPDPANHVHGDHSSSSAAQNCSRVGCSPGSVLGRHYPQKWLSFRSAPTGGNRERKTTQNEGARSARVRRTLARNRTNTGAQQEKKRGTELVCSPYMVERRRIELPTFALRTRRSPS